MNDELASHNHVTRDIKQFGVCPACDRHYVCTCRNGPRTYPDAPPAHDVTCWYPARLRYERIRDEAKTAKETDHA